MKTTITAKNMVVTPGITNRITKKTATMERYLKPDTEMFVRLRRERDERICEITVPMNGVTLRAESSSKDNLFMSIDSALAKLERQILRHRTKLEKRLRECSPLPIIARISKDRLLLDVRTIEERHFAYIAQSIRDCCAQ